MYFFLLNIWRCKVMLKILKTFRMCYKPYIITPSKNIKRSFIRLCCISFAITFIFVFCYDHHKTSVFISKCQRTKKAPV